MNYKIDYVRLGSILEARGRMGGGFTLLWEIKKYLFGEVIYFAECGETAFYYDDGILKCNSGGKGREFAQEVLDHFGKKTIGLYARMVNNECDAF